MDLSKNLIYPQLLALENLFWLETVKVPCSVPQAIRVYLVFPQGAQIVDITTKFDKYLADDMELTMSFNVAVLVDIYDLLSFEPWIEFYIH